MRKPAREKTLLDETENVNDLAYHRSRVMRVGEKFKSPSFPFFKGGHGPTKQIRSFSLHAFSNSAVPTNSSPLLKSMP